MIKKTGVKFTQSEFRELNYCVRCGKMSNIKYGGICDECIEKNLKSCEMCGSILEKGVHKHYSYDTTGSKRDGDITPYVSKNPMIEFIEEIFKDNIFSDTLCKNCQGLEKRIKNICFMCGGNFINSRENYKLNGNMCELCSAIFQ